MDKYEEINCLRLSRKIKVERITQNLSRDKLGDMSGMSGATIANIETDAEKALFKNIIAIAKALDVSLAELLF